MGENSAPSLKKMVQTEKLLKNAKVFLQKKNFTAPPSKILAMPLQCMII